MPVFRILEFGREAALEEGRLAVSCRAPTGVLESD